MRENEPIARPDWFDLFKSFRIASDPAKVWLGFLGASFSILMLLLAFGLMVEVRQLFGGEMSRNFLEQLRRGDSGAAYQTFRKAVARTETSVRLEISCIRDAMFSGRLFRAVARAQALRKTVSWAVVMLLLLLIPWSYFGGAISRSAAVEYATGQRLDVSSAREFAGARWGSYLMCPLSLLLSVAALVCVGVAMGLAASHFIAAAVLVAGFLGSLYALVVVKQKTKAAAPGCLAGTAGLLVSVALTWLVWHIRVRLLSQFLLVLAFPVLLVIGIVVVSLLIVLVLGRGLMASAVSYEGTDAFDAVSRAADYIIKRPWHLAFYSVAWLAYAVPCVAFVVLLAFAGFIVASAIAWAGFGPGFGVMYDAVFPPAPGGTMLATLPGFLLRVVFVLLVGLVAGWGVSFVQSFRVICYALLRKRVDTSAPSEIFAGRNLVRPATVTPEPDTAGRPESVEQ